MYSSEPKERLILWNTEPTSNPPSDHYFVWIKGGKLYTLDSQGVQKEYPVIGDNVEFNNLTVGGSVTGISASDVSAVSSGGGTYSNNFTWTGDHTFRDSVVLDPNVDSHRIFRIIRGTGTDKRSADLSADNLISRDENDNIRSRVDFNSSIAPFVFRNEVHFGEGASGISASDVSAVSSGGGTYSNNFTWTGNQTFDNKIQVNSNLKFGLQAVSNYDFKDNISGWSVNDSSINLSHAGETLRVQKDSGTGFDNFDGVLSSTLSNNTPYKVVIKIKTIRSWPSTALRFYHEDGLQSVSQTTNEQVFYMGNLRNSNSLLFRANEGLDIDIDYVLIFDRNTNNIALNNNWLSPTGRDEGLFIKKDGSTEFSSMPTVGGNPVVESGSMGGANWVRYADGTQIVYYTELLFDDYYGSLSSGQYLISGLTSIPVDFIDINYSSSFNYRGSDGNTGLNYAGGLSASNNEVIRPIGLYRRDVHRIWASTVSDGYSDGDILRASCTLIGRWY